MPNEVSDNKHLCPICGHACSNKERLKVHQRSFHIGTKPFQCDICGKRFEWKRCLIAHGVTHSEEKRFKCDICGMRFKNQAVLYSHKRFHINDRKYVCHICNKGFVTNRILKRHLQSKLTHSVKCKSCNVRFSDQKTLDSHSCDEIGKQYICNLCQKVFNTSSSLKGHVRNHDRKGEFRCTFCSSSYKYNWSLDRHLLSHKSPETHKCFICMKFFKSQRNLKLHLKWHVMSKEKREKKFSCETCGKKFSSKRIVIDHQAYVHLNKRPHECPLCDRAFNTAYVLKRHLLTHTGEKPFTCDKCNNSFSQLSILKRHSCQPSKVPIVYKCSFCSKICKSRLEFAKHKRLHHSKTCNVCKLKFKSIAGMLVHHRYKHNSHPSLKENSLNQVIDSSFLEEHRSYHLHHPAEIPHDVNEKTQLADNKIENSKCVAKSNDTDSIEKCNKDEKPARFQGNFRNNKHKIDTLRTVKNKIHLPHESILLYGNSDDFEIKCTNSPLRILSKTNKINGSIKRKTDVPYTSRKSKRTSSSYVSMKTINAMKTNSMDNMKLSQETLFLHRNSESIQVAKEIKSSDKNGVCKLNAQGNKIKELETFTQGIVKKPLRSNYFSELETKRINDSVVPFTENGNVQNLPMRSNFKKSLIDIYNLIEKINQT